MLQHMLLMMVAPPLILLGAPLIPIVRGMPHLRGARVCRTIPELASRAAHRTRRSPIRSVALLLMGAVMFGWHVPRLYELALTFVFMARV